MIVLYGARSTRTAVESEKARNQINDFSISLNFVRIFAYVEDEAGIGVVRTQAVGECRKFVQQALGLP